MTGTVFSLARTCAWTVGAAFALALAAAPLQAEEADAEEVPPAVAGDTHYELSDPVDSPPVNYRSDYDEDYDTPALHDAEMYAEEYERQQQEEKIRNRDQLDRINDFSAGAITTDGVTP
ncbi:MAG: hypothetical protein RH982_14500 [Parvibaculum sp.]